MRENPQKILTISTFGAIVVIAYDCRDKRRGLTWQRNNHGPFFGRCKSNKGENMTRSQMIAAVAANTDLPAETVEKVMDGVFGTITECLKNDEKVTIAGFGRFEMRTRKAKEFTNPKTKTCTHLEATSAPGFKASSRMKQKLNCK